MLRFSVWRWQRDDQRIGEFFIGRVPPQFAVQSNLPLGRMVPIVGDIDREADGPSLAYEKATNLLHDPEHRISGKLHCVLCF